MNPQYSGIHEQARGSVVRQTGATDAQGRKSGSPVKPATTGASEQRAGRDGANQSLKTNR
jgi:hypothetical protein